MTTNPGAKTRKLSFYDLWKEVIEKAAQQKHKEGRSGPQQVCPIIKLQNIWGPTLGGHGIYYPWVDVIQSSIWRHQLA